MAPTTFAVIFAVLHAVNGCPCPILQIVGSHSSAANKSLGSENPSLGSVEDRGDAARLGYYSGPLQVKKLDGSENFRVK